MCEPTRGSRFDPDAREREPWYDDDQPYQDDDDDRLECPRCGELDLVANRCEGCAFDAVDAGYLLTVDGRPSTAGQAIAEVYRPGSPRAGRAPWARGYRATWAAERARWRRASTMFGPVAGPPWDSFPRSPWSAAPAPVGRHLDELDRRLTRATFFGLGPCPSCGAVGWSSRADGHRCAACTPSAVGPQAIAAALEWLDVGEAPEDNEVKALRPQREVSSREGDEERARSSVELNAPDPEGWPF